MPGNIKATIGPLLYVEVVTSAWQGGDGGNGGGGGGGFSGGRGGGEGNGGCAILTATHDRLSKGHLNYKENSACHIESKQPLL